MESRELMGSTDRTRQWASLPRASHASGSAHQAPLDHQDSQETRARRDIQASRESQEHQEREDHVEDQESRDHSAHRDCQAGQETREMPESTCRESLLQAHRVDRVRWDRQERLDHQERKGSQESRGPKDQPAIRATLERTASRARLDRLAHQEGRELLAAASTAPSRELHQAIKSGGVMEGRMRTDAMIHEEKRSTNSTFITACKIAHAWGQQQRNKDCIALRLSTLHKRQKEPDNEYNVFM